MNASQSKKVLKELIQLKNQSDMINALILEKKQQIAKYFDTTGNRRIEDEEGMVFIQERTNTTFDLPGMLKDLPKKLTSKFIVKEYIVTDWAGLGKILKAHGITPDEVRPFITVNSTLNRKNLDALYDAKEITLKQLKPYMDIKFTKSLALKVNKPEEDEVEEEDE